MSIQSLLCHRYTWPLVILLVGLLVRIWALDLRPAHFDEGVNGWFVDQMAETGYYDYNPENYHGPLHFYALYASSALGGRNLWALRLPTVLVGLLTLLALIGLQRFLPRNACLLAAALAALSPVFTFYNRYAIHESWMALFLVTLSYGILGLLYRNSRKDLWVTLLSLAGLILTKETYIIHLVVGGIAYGCLLLLEGFSPSTDDSGVAPDRNWSGRDLVPAILAAAGLVVFFYSGALLNWPAVSGLVECFASWFETGTDGNGHDKPIPYWLELLVRYEWAGLIGLLSIPLLILPTSRAARLIGIYAFGTVLAFSLIPYKTPWCLLSMMPHLLLLCGLYLHDLVGVWRQRSLAIVMIVILAGHSTWQSVRVNFIEFTNPGHKYVYVQTYEGIRKLPGPLLELAGRDPAARHMRGEIILDSYYPLPWLLGDFSGLAYRSRIASANLKDAAFVVVQVSDIPRLEKMLQFEAFVEDFKLREAQADCRVYFRRDRFEELFTERTPEFRPGGVR